MLTSLSCQFEVINPIMDMKKKEEMFWLGIVILMEI